VDQADRGAVKDHPGRSPRLPPPAQLVPAPNTRHHRHRCQQLPAAPYFSPWFPDHIKVLDLPGKIWPLMEIGVGGYIVGRTVEKGIERWKEPTVASVVLHSDNSSASTLWRNSYAKACVSMAGATVSIPLS